MKRFSENFFRFFLAPASARPLAALRIGVALVLISQALFVRAELMELFGRDGIVQGALADYFSNPYAPRLSLFTSALTKFGMTESTAIHGISIAYFMCLVMLAVGLFTRFASIATWFLHWTFINTGSTTIYGADAFAHMFLFYFIWMPVGSAYSLDCALGRRSHAPTWDARLALRVLQLQLCIAYLASGIEKAAGPQWWNGELLWRAFNLPVYHVFDMEWLVNWPLLSKIGGWGTLVVEIGYSIFIWPRATRRLWVLMTVSLHLGIVVFLGLGIFGFIMAVFTATIFGFDAEPRAEAERAAASPSLVPSPA